MIFWVLGKCNVDPKIFIVLVVSTHWTCSLMTTISGEVSEDITFLHKTFPVPPSMRAIIKVDVSYPISSVGNPFIGTKGHLPVIEFYTTDNHVNVKSQCTSTKYGQVSNTNLKIRLRLHNKPLKCLKQRQGIRYCRGNITVQDFKPRNFSFSFGFPCEEINALSSLKGLVYNISIHEQTNETNCIQLPYDKMKVCKKYYQHTTLPNLFGVEDISRVLQIYDSYIIYDRLIDLVGLCYQHLEELACHTLVPKCDPVSKQVIHPCREMCHDLRTACSKITLPKNTYVSDRMLDEPYVFSGENSIVVDTTPLKFDCDYLPSLSGDIPCLYKHVRCKAPQSVKNAVMSNASMNYNNYSVLDEVDYSCNEGYETEDNKKIFCKYSGEWSTPPKCSLPAKSITPLVVVLPVLLIPLLIPLATFIIKYLIKLNNEIKPDLKIYHQVELDTILNEIKGIDRPLLQLKRPLDSNRNSFFDAFVLYHFDSNDSFVTNHLVPELEEKRKFRLFIHSRNFIPGHDIKQNIEEAIEDSNGAIIVMSQGFVDSIWCKEEFTHCYIENMKDESFNLFVIMMQPADTLVNISPYMKTFFANKTYLDMNDPHLFQKLATHLNNVKLCKDNDINDAEETDASDDD